MERNTEIETEREVLKRIVAMLFVFADLASRAAVRSYPVRCLVLWALRHAEAVVRDWIAGDSAERLQTAPSACAVLHRNSRAEAMHLAKSFRALAHMLKRELRLEERLARRLMRDKANRTEAEMPRRHLVAPDTLRRLVRQMSRAMHLMRGVGFEPPRLDTS